MPQRRFWTILRQFIHCVSAASGDVGCTVEVCTGMGTAGIPRIRAFPAGVGMNVAGIPGGWI